MRNEERKGVRRRENGFDEGVLWEQQEPKRRGDRIFWRVLPLRQEVLRTSYRRKRAGKLRFFLRKRWLETAEEKGLQKMSSHDVERDPPRMDRGRVVVVVVGDKVAVLRMGGPFLFSLKNRAWSIMWGIPKKRIRGM